jgi:methionine sulfoxide reductase heme-binding subunit
VIIGHFLSTSAHLGQHLALAQTSPTLWYLTRASAVSAYVLLTLSVIFGTMRGIARTARERLSWTVDEMHQFTASLMVGMMLIHMTTLKLDPFLPFSIANLLLPVNEPFQPLGVNFGVFAMYSIVVLAFSSWFRRFISYQIWRAIHYISFVAFILVTVHGWLSGSDTNEQWMRAVYIASAASVAFLVFVRLFSRGAPSSSSATA